MKLESDAEHGEALSELERLMEIADLSDSDTEGPTREWVQQLSESIAAYERAHSPPAEPSAALCASCGATVVPVPNAIAWADCPACGAVIGGNAK